MILDANQVREVEREYLANLDSHFSLEQALQTYDELWRHAVDCGALDETNRLRGIDADVEMARTLNALRGA